jgi:hypothetical protein
MASNVAGCDCLDDEVNTSETSVCFYQTTWRNIPEDSHPQEQVISLFISKLICRPYTSVFGILGILSQANLAERSK